MGARKLKPKLGNRIIRDQAEQNGVAMFPRYGAPRGVSIKLNKKLSRLKLVRPTPGLTPSRGFLKLGQRFVGCVLGPAGAVWRKKEGDLATPRGSFSLLTGQYRADRVFRPTSLQILKVTRRNDTWCDDQASFQYNRPSAAPVRFGHEKLWLEVRAYDVVLPLNYNYQPRRLGAGSAIFLHLTENFGPTAGCIAVSLRDMRKILNQISTAAKLNV
jgi:L,D-peptidoglycan transpeptidase YkuD (ErfK/YbiS/YcfS/YnhG family)